MPSFKCGICMNKTIIGIDCGASGCMCVLAGGTVQIVKLDSPGVVEFLKRLATDGSRCFIEEINEQNNRWKELSLSESFGAWKMACRIFGIPVELVKSKTWEMVCGCRLAKYDYARQKEANFQRAKQLFPNTKIFKYSADSVLISYYGSLRV